MPPPRPLPKHPNTRKRPPPDVSFIGMVDFSDQARWIYMTESVKDLLGYQPVDLIGESSISLVHPEEIPQLKVLHLATIEGDKAAAVVYIRMRHKNPDRGYVLCGVSRTICHNVVVGSVSYASAPKGLKLASTAQEVTILSPQGKELFSKWNDPKVMPLDPLPGGGPSFSVHCTIQYCSNDLLLSREIASRRPFFDFVMPEDEENVRKSFEKVKSEGVNEKGQPTIGGFDYGQFSLLPSGRDYMSTMTKKAEGKGRVGKAKVPARTTSSPMNSSAGRPRATSSARLSPPHDPVEVEYIFSAHSDGLLVILRRTPKTRTAQPSSPSSPSPTEGP
ncbi:hypothetical protein DL96DRAFT_1630920 [Flagelloscypha sp. PMI_526]|nr:hypothetical protein DL96DRAFT_1630920 [Flagelloscypha sp. PMI_526]